MPSILKVHKGHRKPSVHPGFIYMRIKRASNFALLPEQFKFFSKIK